MPADLPITDLALAAVDADYQIRDLLSELPAAQRVPFSTLYAYATNVTFAPPADFAARLAADPRSAADLRRLLANLAFGHIPRLAAAATGAVLRRETAEAVLSLMPSRAEPGHVYLTVELIERVVTPPQQLFVLAADGTWQKLVLPPFSEGVTQLILGAEDKIVQALGDSGSEAYLC